MLLNSPVVKYVRLGQFALAIAIYLYYSLTPGDGLHLATSDKYLHFFGNLLLYLSCSVALFGRFRLRLLIALLIPYSLSIELCQYFSPGRSVDVMDMAANMAGLVTGFCLTSLARFAAQQFWPQAPDSGAAAEGC